MSFLTQIERMRRIDFFIRRSGTGNTIEFSRRMNVSKATLIRSINDMKYLGFPIKFNRYRNSYYYEIYGKMTNELFVSQITETKNNNKINLFSWVSENETHA